MNLTFLYVALVWFAGVALWRRWGTAFPWRAAAFFYLLVLLFLWKPLTGAWVHLPVDYLFRLPPWYDLHPGVRPANPELNDLPLQIVPWAHQVREAWKAFEVPLWNPNAAAGYPLLANGQSAPFSIFRLLGLPLSLAHSFVFEAAMKILIALGGAYLFLRRKGYAEVSSVIASIGFAFSTAIVVWLHFPLGTVSALLPAVFLAIDLLWERASWKRFILLALTFSQLLLGGHPETAAHTVFVAGAWLLFRLFVPRDGTGPRNWRGLGRVIGAGTVSLILALPFVLPFIETLESTRRYDMLREFPNLHEVETAPTFLVNFIQPAFFGNVREHTAWGPAHAEVIAGYGGILLVAGWAGMLAWLVKRRQWRAEEMFFAAGVPVLVGIILRWPLLGDAFESLPLFSLAANGRLRLAAVFFAAVLTAAILDRVKEGVRWPLAAGVGFALLALLLAFALNPVDPATAPFHNALRTTLPALAVLLAAALVLRLPARWSRSGLAALLALSTFDVWSHGLPINVTVRDWMFYPRTPIITRLQAIRDARMPEDGMGWRMTATGGMLFPNTAAIYGFEDVRGHDPMANGKVIGILRVLTGYSSESYFGMLRDVTHPVIDFLGVRYVLTTIHEDFSSETWQEVYRGPDGRIFRNAEALPRFFPVKHVLVEFDDEKREAMIVGHRDWAHAAIVKRLPTRLMPLAEGDLFGPKVEGPQARVELTRVEGDRFAMTVDAPRWTLIVSSQPDWPGWRVLRNGGERLQTIKVNEAFMGFLVPPGRSTIDVVYAPRSFWAGFWLAALALGTLAGWGAWRALRHRRRGRAPL